MPIDFTRIEKKYGTPKSLKMAFPLDSKEYKNLIDSMQDGRNSDITLFIFKNGKIIVIAKPWYRKGLYRAPSGGWKPGESLEESASREAYEETGTKITKVYPESSPDITVRIRVTDDGGLQDTHSETVNLLYAPKLVTEKGDIYSLGDIKGHNINFDAAYFIHAGGQISNVTPENFSEYGDIAFPMGTDQYVSSLGFP